ncbi:MAG: hypothetical protein KDA84_07155 [Planctomycetaceae bacterium]|nr:hypothetical protein [Planctomycetaceae bacterium]
MSEPRSVTRWINGLKAGDKEAAARLWERYFEKMVEAARAKLRQHRIGVADEEDVALSAFHSLCLGATEGHFVQLTDRKGLWSLLLTITAQKSVDLIRWEKRKRRGGGKVLRESDLGSEQQQLIDKIFSQGPTPEFLMLMEEECSRLLSQLRDDTLRNIVKAKLEGQTNEQIAGMLGISVHAIARKIRIIRTIWSRELHLPDGGKEPPAA